MDVRNPKNHDFGDCNHQNIIIFGDYDPASANCTCSSRKVF